MGARRGVLYLYPLIVEQNFGGSIMKKIALAAAISLTASTAFAGSPAPAVEPIIETIEEGSSSSSSGALLPILVLLLIGAAVAASD